MLKKIEFKEIVKEKKISKQKHFIYKLDNYTRKYQELFHKTEFINESLSIDNNKIIIPLTKNKKSNDYSLYGDPIEIFFDEIISFKNYEIIDKYFKKLKEKKIFKFKIDNEKEIINNKSPLVEKIIYEIYIDLSENIETIKSRFSSNLRNEINRNYENTKYEIVDKNNYEMNEIFKMMKFHIKVSGRQTRSDETWKINEDMLLNDQGFLTRIKYKNDVISYSFFCHDKYTCNYLSSVGERDHYKIIRNMHHKSLWMAINHSKKSNCKYFFVGPITLYSKEEISKKEKNIENFKSKFKGTNSKFVILNDLPDYKYYKKFIMGIG